MLCIHPTTGKVIFCGVWFSFSKTIPFVVLSPAKLAVGDLTGKHDRTSQLTALPTRILSLASVKESVAPLKLRPEEPRSLHVCTSGESAAARKQWAELRPLGDTRHGHGRGAGVGGVNPDPGRLTCLLWDGGGIPGTSTDKGKNAAPGAVLCEESARAGWLAGWLAGVPRGLVIQSLGWGGEGL